jgi:hypothetical protein
MPAFKAIRAVDQKGKSFPRFPWSSMMATAMTGVFDRSAATDLPSDASV